MFFFYSEAPCLALFWNTTAVEARSVEKLYPHHNVGFDLYIDNVSYLLNGEDNKGS